MCKIRQARVLRVRGKRQQEPIRQARQQHTKRGQGQQQGRAVLTRDTTQDLNASRWTLLGDGREGTGLGKSSAGRGCWRRGAEACGCGEKTKNYGTARQTARLPITPAWPLQQTGSDAARWSSMTKIIGTEKNSCGEGSLRLDPDC